VGQFPSIIYRARSRRCTVFLRSWLGAAQTKQPARFESAFLPLNRIKANVQSRDTVNALNERLRDHAVNDSPETVPSRRKRIRWLGMTVSMRCFIILDHQHEQQLSAADLWTFDDERTAFA